MRQRQRRTLAVIAVVTASLGVGACTTAGAYDPTPLYTPSASPPPSPTRDPHARHRHRRAPTS